MNIKTWFKWGAAVTLAAGGVRAADIQPSNQPPGGLSPSATPQIVLLTFDDSVTSASYVRVQQAVTNLFNPNGHAIKATFFVSMDSNYDPSAIRRLYDAGHEIAIHTMSHATGTNSSLTRWRQEIAGERRTLERLCGIPQEDIVGFRAPFLLPNDATFQVLAEREFLYDASFPEELGGHSTDPAHMLWPYTLNQGLAQSAPAERAPAKAYPGLFEIPLWAQFTNGASCVSMDPPEAFGTNQVMALWQANFLSHYNGNRAPYGIFLHATSTTQWLSAPAKAEERIAVLRAFIAWALTMPDTWFVTCRDLAEYMQDPVSTAEAAMHPAFQTPERVPFPASGVSRCSYPGSHTLNVCGACPAAAPSYTNAYLGLVPIKGGEVSISVLSQNVSYAWCEMTVSNNQAQSIYDWSASFEAHGGAVGAFYDTVWTQADEYVVAYAKQYARQLAPGAARVLSFRVTRRTSGSVSFSDVEMASWSLGQQPIRVSIGRSAEPSGWTLSWNDDAHLYEVETTTSLAAPQAWVTVTNGLCQPVVIEPQTLDGAPHFYRVKGTVF